MAADYWLPRVPKQLHSMTHALNELKNIEPVKNFSEAFANQNKNIILIIGENTNRLHLSLYGYERKTTPLLDKRSDIKVLKNAMRLGPIPSNPCSKCLPLLIKTIQIFTKISHRLSPS